VGFGLANISVSWVISKVAASLGSGEYGPGIDVAEIKNLSFSATIHRAAIFHC
jgi:hypothetical protein